MRSAENVELEGIVNDEFWWSSAAMRIEFFAKANMVFVMGIPEEQKGLTVEEYLADEQNSEIRR